MHLTNGFKVRRQREILLVIVPQNPENSSGEISILAKILYFLIFFSLFQWAWHNFAFEGRRA